MPSKVMVQFVAGIVIAVFAFGILAGGERPNPEWLRFYSVSVVVVGICLWVWENWLWRTWIGQRFSKVPVDIRGTWRGTLGSFWNGPDGRAPSKTVYLVIRQSASNVSVILMTDESRSRSSLSAVLTETECPTLEYMYLNRPSSRLEHQSRMHYGSAFLDITGRPATRLSGQYWTNRDSRGELEFTERLDKFVGDYLEAEKAFIKQ